METRTGHVFLGLALLIISTLMLGTARAETGTPEQVIKPSLKREPIKPARIDTENFELGAYVGMLSIEDFGTGSVTGARLAYHFSEDFFAEASYGQTTAGKSSIEKDLIGSAQYLTDAEREYSYYNLSFGFNVLPGEAFIGSGRAFHTALYLVAGTGSTEFAGDDRHTLNLGFGYRFIFNDWLAGHLDARDHIFDIDLTGNKTSHNLEVSTGLTLFF